MQCCIYLPQRSSKGHSIDFLFLLCRSASYGLDCWENFQRSIWLSGCFWNELWTYLRFVSHRYSWNNTKAQSRLWPGHGTETTLLVLMDDLLLSMNRGKTSIRNLSAVFDTVSHEILLSHLGEVASVQGNGLMDWVLPGGTHLLSSNGKMHLHH